jgi:ubiquinone/menaquinone biosynthesis C-methylase UbiE
MGFQARHDVLPEATHDEFAREEFCGSLRKFFTATLFPENAKLYKTQLEPAFIEKHGRPPANRLEVKKLMEDTFFYRGASLVGRTAQEMLWDTVSESAERQIEELQAKAASMEHPLGTLRLDPDAKIPRYLDAVDIHVMPGNWQCEFGPDDMLQGATYDRGVHVFAYGGLGEYNDGMGKALISFLRENFSHLKPRRILDMGCTVGHNTCVMAEAFPEAEVYGVDLGAPCLRYAHARAESLGYKVHFSQQDITKTDFPDGYFDLVFSILVLHEVPAETIKGLFKECHRVLAPGGAMIHDGWQRTEEGRDPFTQFISGWFEHNNNEPFSSNQGNLQYRAAFAEAGFDSDSFFQGMGEAVYLKGQISGTGFVGAVKS